MIKIKIVVIGKTKEKIYLKKIQEYLKWTSKDIKVELIFLKDDKKEENIIKKLNQYFNPSLYTICLSEEGSQLSSKKFSNLIYEQSRDIVFFIGGPDGHPEEIREKSNFLLSFSFMTFPHEMALLILSEQIFRAASIKNGHKYHRS